MFNRLIGLRSTCHVKCEVFFCFFFPIVACFTFCVFVFPERSETMESGAPPANQQQVQYVYVSADGQQTTSDGKPFVPPHQPQVMQVVSGQPPPQVVWQQPGQLPADQQYGGPPQQYQPQFIAPHSFVSENNGGGHRGRDRARSASSDKYYRRRSRSRDDRRRRSRTPDRRRHDSRDRRPRSRGRRRRSSSRDDRRRRHSSRDRRRDVSRDRRRSRSRSRDDDRRGGKKNEKKNEKRNNDRRGADPPSEKTQHLRHPCIRVFGRCGVHDCQFANYPYNTCLAYIKGKCRKDPQHCSEPHDIDVNDPKYKQKDHGDRRHPCIRMFGQCTNKNCQFVNFPYATCFRHLSNSCKYGPDRCDDSHAVNRDDPRYQRTGSVPSPNAFTEASAPLQFRKVDTTIRVNLKIQPLSGPSAPDAGAVPPPGTLHAPKLGQDVPFFVFPSEDDLSTMASSTEFVPPVDKEQLARVFIGQLPYTTSERLMQWIALNFGGGTRLFFVEKITKASSRPTGCFHAHVLPEDIDRLFVGLDKKVLMDTTGLWATPYAGKVDDAMDAVHPPTTPELQEEDEANLAILATMQNYANALKADTEVRVRGMPWNVIVVQMATSNYGSRRMDDSKTQLKGKEDRRGGQRQNDRRNNRDRISGGKRRDRSPPRRGDDDDRRPSKRRRH